MGSETPTSPTISVVIVTYRQGEAVRPTLEALGRELAEGDELVVVDNASGDGTAEAVEAVAPDAELIRSGENAGFPAACNLGAASASGELLVFLNPDAVPAPGWREAILRPLAAGEWGAWQALVTTDGGTLVNTRGGVVHFTGVAWAGGSGRPVAEGLDGREPGFVSGACLAIPREYFELLGGFAPEFFLYHEDVDLSLRARLGGARLGVASDARVEHAYEFAKGPHKWRFLERNRWATVIRTYPAPLLALLAPALLATELALVAVSIADGWFAQKRAAWGDVLRALPRLREERRAIQRTRSVGAREFAAALTPDLDSPYLGAVARSGVLAGALRGYWRVVGLLLGAGR